ncbi:MAG TPA: PAS domain-containing protein [Candidatus Acidoferrum sp.]|nr:PAS domain-containing protein [Candidatus Acidoferrum sp.]
MSWFGHHLGTWVAAGNPKEEPGAVGANPPAAMSAKARLTAIGFVYTCLVGLLDLTTTRGLNFDLFYLCGCAFVGWAAGARPALFITFTSGIFLYFDGARSGGFALPAWVVYWNSVLRLLGFAATGWLAGELGRSTRTLERAVQERAGRLRSEVEEHKETAVRLRETLELFRQVTENITEVFWVTDPAKTRVNYVSRGFETVWGQPRQAIYTSPGVWLAAVCDQDRERVTRATYAKQITGDYDEEYRVKRPDGSLCWVHDRAFPVVNEKSEVYRIVGITEDVTEQKRVEQLLEAQRDVAVALSVASDLNAALDRLLQAATGLEGIDCGGVYLLDEESGALGLEAHVGLSPGFVSQVATFGAGSREAWLVKEGRPLYPICAPGWNTEDAFWVGEGLRALAVLPLKHEGKVLGALNLGSHAQDELAVATRVGIETIAAQAAGAIARIRLERQILEISDLEQARIGQDIHDGLCQQLIGMAFTANALHQSLIAEQRPEAAPARKITTLLDEAITESRRVCRGLYPVRLETEGLVPALEELATTTSERFNVQCLWEAATRRLHCNVTTATHLYRIAQEAVNNAIKHSGGRTISIRLRESAGEIELEVSDDGRGLQATPERRAGMGLHIMDYRARSIGGTLRISGNAPGTVVLCRVPHREVVLGRAADSV